MLLKEVKISSWPQIFFLGRRNCIKQGKEKITRHRKRNPQSEKTSTILKQNNLSDALKRLISEEVIKALK